jgi:diguanylate cyclase (GGDEF)-like protein/PAS domain S-box-containing protein
VHGQALFAGRPRWMRNVGFGVVMGVGAVASMLLAIQIEGSLFDLRSSLIAIAAFFGGPIAGAVGVVIAVAYRVVLVGGPQSVPAISGIALAALIGVGVSVLTRRRVPALTSGLILALAVAGGSLGLSVVLRVATVGGFAPLSLLVALMNAAATLVSAFFIMRNRVVERERDLLRAALVEWPDMHYVKTPDGRFAAVNKRVARHHGYASPEAMIGKSDLDLETPERGQVMFAEEQAVLRGGAPIVEREEMIVNAKGERVWYLTSKVALHDVEGHVIGLAGVTRDVTVRRRLRDEAEESRNRLDYVLAGVSDGIAMFDRYGVLVYCNAQYRDMFPVTREVRQPGRHINDILRAVAETGEQKGIPAGLEEQWIEEVAATLDSTGEQEIQLSNERWLHVRTRPTADGASLVVVSDVTTLKKTESALRITTEQLRLLATTDGLTGLTNRRAFDQALENEVARAQRSGLPLSVLMIDVDRFKAYNDLYGHPAGDEVLRRVGLCLRGAIKRPGDVAARYGGEEFVAILPNTDEDAALFIANALRDGLHLLEMPHSGSEMRIVTASIGIASLLSGTELDAAGLMARADEADYVA